MHGREAKAGVIVDRHVQVLPAGPRGPAGAVAGDAVSGPHDAAELLDVHVHELAGTLALVADDLLAWRRRRESRTAMAAEHGMHSRGRDPQGPPDHVRSLAQLRARTQDCLLDDVGRLPGRGMRPARAITKVLAAKSPVDPIGSRLSGTANDERGCCDRHPGGDQVAHTLTLTNRQDRICMKIHKSPPSVATRTSRTLGGLNDALRCQQRVWELHLERLAGGREQPTQDQRPPGAPVETL